MAMCRAREPANLVEALVSTLYTVEDRIGTRWRPSPTLLDRQGRHTHASRSDAENAIRR